MIVLILKTKDSRRKKDIIVWDSGFVAIPEREIAVIYLRLMRKQAGDDAWH